MPKPDASAATVEAVLWTDGPHADLLARLLDLMGESIRVLAVGGPRVAPVADLARRLGHEPTDDLRHMLISHPAAFAVFAAADPPDDEDLAAAARAGARPLCLEPLAADFDQLHALQRRQPKDAPARLGPVNAPAFLQAPGFRLAAEPFEQLGDRPNLVLESLGAPGAGSLFARLLDAWRTALAFIDLPQTIEAQITPAPAHAHGKVAAHAPGTTPEKNPGSAAGALPETLPGLAGRLSAHGRTDDGGSVCLFLADHAVAHRRRLLALSDQTQLEVTDTGYRFDNADGSPIDAAGELHQTISYLDLIADQWRRLLDTHPGHTADAPAGGAFASSSVGSAASGTSGTSGGGGGFASGGGGTSGGGGGFASGGGGGGEADALACCLACLLSARTGQPENPRTLQRMR